MPVREDELFPLCAIIGRALQRRVEPAGREFQPMVGWTGKKNRWEDELNGGPKDKHSMPFRN